MCIPFMVFSVKYNMNNRSKLHAQGSHSARLVNYQREILCQYKELLKACKFTKCYLVYHIRVFEMMVLHLQFTRGEYYYME